jgi:hypothetical protein
MAKNLRMIRPTQNKQAFCTQYDKQKIKVLVHFQLAALRAWEYICSICEYNSFSL